MQILIAVIGIGFTIILAVGATWYYLDREYERQEKPAPEPDMDGLAVSQHMKLTEDKDNRYDYE